MEFDECNPIVLLSVLGLILIALCLIYSRQDGFMLKLIIAILAGTCGLAVEVPGFLKGGKKE